MNIIINETLPAIEDIVKSGKAKYIGLTAYPVSTLLECIERSKTNIDMILSYTRLTMIDDTLNHFIPKLQVCFLSILSSGCSCMSFSGKRYWNSKRFSQWYGAAKQFWAARLASSTTRN